MKILLSILLATAIPISAQSAEPSKEKKSPAKRQSAGIVEGVSKTTKNKTSDAKRTPPGVTEDDSGPAKEKKNPAKRQTAGIVEGASKTTKNKTSDEKRTPPDVTEDDAGPAKEKKSHAQPAVIDTEKLLEFEALPEDRKNLIRGAINVAKESPWLPYQFGGADPKAGGFDCSGAMYYVMRKADLEPPRSSAEQFLWIKEHQRLVETDSDVKDLDHPDFKKLQPGDLLFWGGTYAPVDGRKVNITHVAMYLGHEKSDNRAVMINATDGRSYRGTKANGYGVYDFQLPKEGTKVVFMGYGTPPGIK